MISSLSETPVEEEDGQEEVKNERKNRRRKYVRAEVDLEEVEGY